MKLKPIPISSFNFGETYPFDVFLQVSEAKVIQIYKKDFEVSLEDIQRLEKYPDGKVLVSKEDHVKYFENNLADDLGKQISSGAPIDQQKAENLFCYAMYREEGLNDNDFINDVIKKSQKISLKLFDSPEARKDKISNFNILSELCKSEETFAAHSQATLTLGSLFMLATPGVTMDNLTNIGHMAFLHGFAMEYLIDKSKKTVFHKLLDPDTIKISVTKESQTVKDAIFNHLNGHELKDFNGVSSYLKHFYIMEKVLEQSSFGKNPGTTRAIKEFKHFETPPQYRTTNKLSNYFVVTSKFVIVDHLITLINKRLKESNNFNDDLIGSCLTELKEKQQAEGPVFEYDQKMLNAFIDFSRTKM